VLLAGWCASGVRVGAGGALPGRHEPKVQSVRLWVRLMVVVVGSVEGCGLPEESGELACARDRDDADRFASLLA
jgi:hypothetical protein